MDDDGDGETDRVGEGVVLRTDAEVALLLFLLPA